MIDSGAGSEVHVSVPSAWSPTSTAVAPPLLVRRLISNLVDSDLETLAHACYSGLHTEAARSAREYRC